MSDTSGDTSNPGRGGGSPVQLATVAYHAALAGRWGQAALTISRIGEEYGGAGVTRALMAWCDAYILHATDGKPSAGRVQMAFINANTGELDDDQSDQLPDRIRWAGRLVAARVAMDQGLFSQLLASLPDDPPTVGQHVLAVLECVVGTVNGLPRGFAVMGRQGSGGDG